MPAYKRRFRRRARKAGRRMRRNPRVTRSLMYNPRPVFTESFRLLTDGQPQVPFLINPNTGGILRVAMSQIPQRTQYSTLYQKYRIIKAKFILIPTYNTMAADVNSEFASPAPPPASINIGMSRFVYAVNDSPNLTAPISEDGVLQDNGCKIIVGKPKIVMTCRPVPDTADANGNKMTFRRKYLNFATAGTDIQHFGITYWHSQAGLGQPQGFGVPYFVYCKLTFQLADPR